MKKLFLMGILLCSAIILIGAQTGFAWDTYEGGCQTCHGTGFSGLTPLCIPYMPLRLAPYVIRELPAQNLFQLLPVRDVTLLLIREFAL